jgi:hypothetical protein
MAWYTNRGMAFGNVITLIGIIVMAVLVISFVWELSYEKKIFGIHNSHYRFRILNWTLLCFDG